MRSALFLLLFAVSCATTHKIYEIKSMSEVEPWITSDTLLIFDLDNTLFESKDMVAHANWFHDITKKYPHQQEKILRRTWKAIKSAEYKPVEEITPDLIRKWQNQGIAIMALTSRDLELEEATLRQIRSVGVDFSKTSPYRKSQYFREGVLFADNNYPKGKALLAYLKDTSFKPKQIILVDDLKKNLVSVAEVTGAIGLLYPLVDNKRHLEWDEKEAERLWLSEAPSP